MTNDNTMQKSTTLQNDYTFGDFALRELKESDLELARVWRNSEHVRRWTFTEDDITPEAQLKWFHSRRNRSDYAVIKGKETVGFTCLYEKNDLHKNCQMGFYIGEEKNIGLGLGAIVEFMTLDLTFMEWRYNKVWGFVLPEHKKILSMHRKFGFQEEGLFKNHFLKKDHFVDVVVVGLLREEWLKNRDRYIEFLKEFSGA